MRHLGSLIAGLVLAPTVWLLLAIGQPQTATVFARWSDDNTYDTADLIGPVAYLVAAGLLLGLVATLRISPLGPVVAGLLYTALYGVMFVDPLWGLDHIPDSIDLRLVDAQPHVPIVNGTMAILAICLLTPAFSGKRWLRWPSPATSQATAQEAGTDLMVQEQPAIWTPPMQALPAAPAPAAPASSDQPAQQDASEVRTEPGTTMVLSSQPEPQVAGNGSTNDAARSDKSDTSVEPGTDSGDEEVSGSPWAGKPRAQRG